MGAGGEPRQSGVSGLSNLLDWTWMKAWTGGDIIKTLNHNGEGPADYLFKFCGGPRRGVGGPGLGSGAEPMERATHD